MSAPPTTRFAAAWITDTANQIILDLSNSAALPYAVTDLDPGMPAIRASASDAPGRPGSINLTRFFGARAVTLGLVADDDSARRALMTTLSELADPAQRFYLVVQVPEWGTGQWRMLLVADQFSMPLTYSDADLTAGWQAPGGVWESAVELTRNVLLGGVQTGGKTYPLSYPRDYGTGSAPGSGVITIKQNQPTPPTIKIFGPVTAPAIANATTGATIAFASTFTIAANQYVAIDCSGDTSPRVTANSDPTLSREQFIDWSQSNLWWLASGPNQIQFTGTGASAVTQAVLTWRERRL